MSYKVIVNESKVKFSASHFLKEHFKCARLHGHNYYVAVEVSDNLDENYFVVDFMELGTKLKEIIEPLDHYILIPSKAEGIKIKEDGDSVEVLVGAKRYVFPREDVCFLPLPATTSELLAKYIHGKLKEFYKDKKLLVKVGESKSSMATYKE
ncbi:MAG: 6-pyruvoyl trahydropterin synthase family protein [Promethearchaeota archaeon]